VLDSYEAGLKGEFFDRRLIVTAAALGSQSFEFEGLSERNSSIGDCCGFAVPAAPLTFGVTLGLHWH
jgi:hypothetical protein